MARFDAVAQTLTAYTFELLLVNDGSSDGTQALIETYARDDARVRGLSFSRNFGKEAALLAGLMHTTGDLVSVMDADLQDPPELLLQMLQMMDETGCDCVAARRVTREGEPPVRSFFARLFYRLINMISSVRVEDGVRDFRLMRREMVDAILQLPERRRFSKGLFAWVGFDVRYLPYENVERAAGVTKWSFWSLLVYALEGVFSFTAMPLQLPFYIAVPVFLVCLFLAISGQWTAALICIAADAVLLCLGMVGQYIARIFWETKRRPLYITRAEKHSCPE